MHTGNRVIDPEGAQDVFSFSTEDGCGYHGAVHTRVHVRRLLLLQINPGAPGPIGPRDYARRAR
jgi:hypothetical protein